MPSLPSVVLNTFSVIVAYLKKFSTSVNYFYEKFIAYF